MGVILRSSINKKEALPIAGIHATILSIFVAVFSTYGIFVHSSLSQARKSVVQEANKADRIMNWSSSISVGTDEVCTGTLAEDWEGILHQLTEISDMNSKDLYLQKGEEVFCILYALHKKYPFAVTDEIGMKTEGYHRFHFKNFNQVNTWVRDLEKVLLAVDTCEPKLREILDYYYDEITWGDHAKHYIDRLFSSCAEIEKYLQHMKELIAKASTYEFALFQKPLFMSLSIMFAGFVFFSGVVLPMISSKVNKIFVLWIPIAFYLSVFVYLFYRFIGLSS